MARWLITGGAGFIGSHIAEKLVQKGEKVRVLDNFSSGKKDYLKNIKTKIELIIGDIRDEAAVQRSCKGMDYVLHEAALRSVPRSIEKPQECDSVNIRGTLNCLLAAKDAKVKRFVFASSSSIYGNSTQFPQKESILPQPISPYAASKIAGEHYCNVFLESFGLSAVCLRYFNVFGPRQDPESKYAAVIPRFIIAALKGEPLEVHWDGKQSRDFSYVEDVAQANILAATAKNPKQLAYNVACGDSISLLDIIDMIERIMNRTLTKKFFPKRKGDVRKTYSSISAIQRDLKFHPQFPFYRGLKSTYNFFKEKDRWKNYKIEFSNNS